MGGSMIRKSLAVALACVLSITGVSGVASADDRLPDEETERPVEHGTGQTEGAEKDTEQQAGELDVAPSPTDVSEAPSCVAALQPDGTVVVTLQGEWPPGVSQVFRNGALLGYLDEFNTPGTAFFDTAPPRGVALSYEVRIEEFSVSCGVVTIAGPWCTATVASDGTVTVTVNGLPKFTRARIEGVLQGHVFKVGSTASTLRDTTFRWFGISVNEQVVSYRAVLRDGTVIECGEVAIPEVWCVAYKTGPINEGTMTQPIRIEANPLQPFAVTVGVWPHLPFPWPYVKFFYFDAEPDPNVIDTWVAVLPKADGSLVPFTASIDLGTIAGTIHRDCGTIYPEWPSA